MDTVNNEWGYLIAALALLSVVAIFGLAYRFIRSAMDSNKRFRWLQIIDRRERQGRRENNLDRR